MIRVLIEKEIYCGFASLRFFAILFLFSLFSGLAFFYYTDTFISIQSQALSKGGPILKPSQLLLVYFEALHFVFLIMISALTMGAFTEEKKQNTLRFLQSSPLSSWNLVFSKYAAQMLFMSLALLVSAVYPLYLLYYSHLDPNLVLCSYLAALLVLSSYTAFGLWMSAIASSPLTAFLFTSLGLLSFLLMGSSSALFKAYPWFESILAYLGSSEHYSMIAKGILTVSDLGYFLSTSSLYLFFSLLSYESLRWK
ncbi:MAG: ABC transporter permease subunit [Oligoflexales bacterium]|nr:ABC transporter permease subunit [Oligoflexales bacterium]